MTEPGPPPSAAAAAAAPAPEMTPPANAGTGAGTGAGGVPDAAPAPAAVAAAVAAAPQRYVAPARRNKRPLDAGYSSSSFSSLPPPAVRLSMGGAIGVEGGGGGGGTCATHAEPMPTAPASLLPPPPPPASAAPEGPPQLPAPAPTPAPDASPVAQSPRHYVSPRVLAQMRQQQQQPQPPPPAPPPPGAPARPASSPAALCKGATTSTTSSFMMPPPPPPPQAPAYAPTGASRPMTAPAPQQPQHHRAQWQQQHQHPRPASAPQPQGGGQHHQQPQPSSRGRGGGGRGRGRGGRGGGGGDGVGPPMPQAGLGIWRGRGGAGGGGGGDGGGRGANGRGGRGRMAYLSLNGETFVGADAMARSKADRALVQQGKTFTQQRERIRAACLAAEARAAAAAAATAEGGVGGAALGEVEAEKRRLGYPGWGLPEEVVRTYEEELGVRQLFPWQVECLEAGDGAVLRERANLVYSAPTSGGKTMVAELLMLRALTHSVEAGTALLVVPFIALAEEKARYLRRAWAALELGVKCFHSDALDSSLSESVHVAVCTIERANALVNRLLERGELGRLRAVVVDEMHLIADEHRGFMIEVMLAKLRMAQRRGLHPDLQIIGLSATLPNLDQVARWLGARLYITDFRPVRLALCVCNCRAVARLVPEVGPGQGTGQWVHDRDLPVEDETQALAQLCLEVVAAGAGAAGGAGGKGEGGVLVFCMARKWCEQSAARVSEALGGLQLGGHLAALGPEAQAGRQELLARLRLTSVGLAPELERCIPQGVAFHHAGLTGEERTLLEGAFKAGVLRVLVATSTLAAGVNLPARRVVVRSRRAYNGEDMSAAQFQQMCGRAGRFGIDAIGEAVLMCRPNELSAAQAFVGRQLPPMQSALDRGLGGGVERAVLEVITGRLARQGGGGGGEGPEEEGEEEEGQWLEVFASSTLFWAQQPCPRQALARFQAALDYLVKERFVAGRPSSSSSSASAAAADAPAADAPAADAPAAGAPTTTAAAEALAPPAMRLTGLRETQLGAAAFFSSMAPHDAAEVAASLATAARGGIILSSDLHLLFLCVPPNRRFVPPDWAALCRRALRWPEGVKAVAEAVGIHEVMLERLAVDGQPRGPGDERLLRRFLYACLLHDMLQEVPLVKMEDQEVGRGSLQQLRNESQMFCGMVAVLCRHLKWDTLSRLIQGLSKRLEHGVAEELLPLFRIGPDLVHAHRARALFDAGFKTHADLAAAQPEAIAAVLIGSMPFQADGRSRENGARVARRLGEQIVRKARALVRKDLGPGAGMGVGLVGAGVGGVVVG